VVAQPVRNSTAAQEILLRIFRRASAGRGMGVCQCHRLFRSVHGHGVVAAPNLHGL